jgi:hypothetical protein
LHRVSRRWSWLRRWCGLWCGLWRNGRRCWRCARRRCRGIGKGSLGAIGSHALADCCGDTVIRIARSSRRFRQRLSCDALLRNTFTNRRRLTKFWRFRVNLTLNFDGCRSLTAGFAGAGCINALANRIRLAVGGGIRLLCGSHLHIRHRWRGWRYRHRGRRGWLHRRWCGRSW